MQIGYIGLGLMGKPCVRNLMRAGHKILIWARRPETVRDLMAAGAEWRASPAALASEVELLFTNLPDTGDVEAVLLGADGVRHGGKAGLLVADMSTISATATQRIAAELAESGIRFADTPVSGGTSGAADGTLTIMVGAEEEDFAKLLPVLKAMGRTVTRIGGVGAGQVAKSCNQIVITGAILAVAEAFKLARSMGVDPAKVREALLGGFAASRVLELHGQRMLQDDYAPGFKAALHLKDMRIVSDIAMELDLVLPQSTVGLDLLAQAVAAGLGEYDSSVLSKIIESL